MNKNQIFEQLKRGALWLVKRVADLEKTQGQQSIEEDQKRFDELIQKYLDTPNRLKF